MRSGSAGWPRLLRRQFEFVDHRIGLVRLENLESLLRDVLPERSYPIEWVIFRMTGIDSETEGEPAPVRGETLIPELVELIEDMSRSLGPLPFDPERDLSVEESARRLGVSTRTLRRWRPRGLPVLRFDGVEGGARVGVRRVQLGWFTRMYRPQVERARARRPVGETEAASIRRRFRELRERSETDTAAVRIVAGESRRSVSTVRRLVGIDRPTEVPASERRDWMRRLVLRGFDRSLPLPELAARVGRSVRSVHRIVLEERRRRLHDLPSVQVVPEGVERPDAGRVFGAAGLLDARCRAEAHGSLSTWLAGVRHGEASDPETVRERLAAMHFALWRAHRGLASVATDDRPPTATGLDAIESDVRWWALLRERSIQEGLAAGLRRLEQSIGRSIEDLPAGRLLELLDRLVETTATVVDGFDPQRRVLEHSLERACGLAASRMMATVDPTAVSTTARARADLAAIPSPDLLRSTPSCARVLLAVERWWRGGGDGAASAPGREACMAHHGLGDPDRPRSWREVARILGRPASHLSTDALAFERATRRRAIAGSPSDRSEDRG